MATLKEVRNRIHSVSSTQKITKAMKMVSASKLVRSMNAIIKLRPYAETFKEVLSRVSVSLQDNKSPFIVDRVPFKVMIILVTSDKGLVGTFNANVIKAVNHLVNQKYDKQFSNGDGSIIAIGKRGHDYFSKRDFNMVGDYSSLFNNLSFDNVSKMTDHIMEEFRIGNIDRVEMVYNQFHNAALQILTTEQFLPFLPDNTSQELESETEYIMEPSKERIAEDLIPKAIKLQIYKAFLDSHASEHGARMTAMDKASENAEEMIKTLKLSYNQARQNAITSEIIEISSGAEALSHHKK